MLLNQLSSQNNAAFGNALRISTGQKINSAADSPSGIIRLTELQRDLKVVNSTTTAIDLATSVGAQTQQNLDLVRTQLNTIRTSLLKDEDQTLTAPEQLAEQAIIDAAVDELDRIAGLEIEGHRVLQGANDFMTTGFDSSQIERLEVYSSNATRITGSVSAAATGASITYTGTSGQVSADADITLNGPDGSQVFSLLTGGSLADFAVRINMESHNTGLSAVVVGDDLTISTIEVALSVAWS